MSSVPFHFRTHSNDTDSVLTVMSLYPDTPTVTFNGDSVSAGTRIDVGTDDGGSLSSYGLETTGAPIGVACFVWRITVSGLQSDSFYSIAVTQNGATINGSTRTQLAPEDDSDFSFFFITCDGRNDGAFDKGSWGYMLEYSKTNKVTAIIHPDDHGYSNSYRSLNQDGNLRWTGQISPNNTTNKTGYAYTVAYCSYLGLLEKSDSYALTLTDIFSDPDRQECWNTIPMIVVGGDHEMTNNAEENTNVTANQMVQVKDVFSKTLASGQNFINFTNSVATRDVMGPIEVICPDRLFGLTPLSPVVDIVTRVPTGVGWLGANQKADLRGAVDSVSPFKLFGMSMSLRDIMDTADQIAINSQAPPEDWVYSTLGAQQPLHNYTLVAGDSDFTDIFTNKSLGGMLTGFTSDYTPVTLALHGDTHRPYEYYHYQPETDLHAGIDLYEISSGSVNGNQMHGLHTSINQYYQYSPVTVTWIPDFTTRNQLYAPTEVDIDNGYTPSAFIPTILRVDMSKKSGHWVMSIHTVQCDGLTSKGKIIRTVTLDENKANAPDYLRRGTI